ncbi:MAG: cation-translocating P-type ATPase [Phycisphaerales bacterium]
MSHAATHDHEHDHHDHQHGESKLECCSHHELEIDRWIVVYLVGGVLALTGWIAERAGAPEQVAVLPAVVGSIMLALPLFIAAGGEILRKRVSSSSLAALAILAAMAIGEFTIAAFLAFVLLVADQIVRRTAFGAQRAIEALIGLTPDVARVVGDDGLEHEVGIEQIAVGQIVRVRPGENLPVDGRVVSGRSTINQASLTGEALPVEVEEGTDVYAGTTNLTGSIDLVVTLVGEDTTIGKVTTLIREAENSKTPRQMLIEQVARFYVPVALTLAALVFFLFAQSGEESVRDKAALTAVTVLVVTCPTALLLSSPTAMVAAFASAARLGVMIKRTNYLEAASNIDTVILDKTGTITTGNFEVSRLAPAEGVEGAELLEAAATAEAGSNHPLAQSIVQTARAARIELGSAPTAEELHGRGVRARTEAGELCVGRASWIRELAPQSRAQIAQVESRIEGMSGVHVLRDGQYLGAVGLEDKVRASASSVLDRLRQLGVRSVAIFTGDRLSVAKRVGVAVGADEIEAECLPEEKFKLVQQMTASGQKVMMVGDGINDGPALAEADLGVAMGLSGSDIAANSAGVALMTDELNRLPFLIELSRRTRAIVMQNIAVSILMAIIGLTLAATGTFAEAGAIGVGFAALFHFAPDIFVVGNSFRLFRYGEDFHQAEAEAKAAAAAPRRQMREGSIRRLGAQPA